MNSTDRLAITLDAIYRHGRGELLSGIAESYQITEQELCVMVWEYCSREELAKLKSDARKARDIARYIEQDKICKLNRQQVLQKLEAGEIDDVKDHCQIEKVYGDRVAIAEGKATERVDTILNVVGLEKIEI